MKRRRILKPELLILEGVYSYKHRTEIDFSTLCSAELFGIFGNVGSGKSAVLEAITYVLYGRIERLSNRVYYNMMNLASNRMYIDFTFSSKGRNYRFTFETKRNKKDFSKIETPQRSAYVLESGDWRPLFDKDSSVSADEIIGLNYDNFRRTVIVPQGKFQEFLHLEQSKRTAMLMDLFKLDRFDLYAKAAGLSSRNNEKIAAVEGELSGLSDFSEAAAEEAEREAEILRKKSGELGEAVKKGEEKISELRETAGLDGSLTAARKALEMKTAEEEAVKVRKRELQVYEDCVARFKSRIEIHTMLSRDAAAAGSQLEEARKRMDDGKTLLADAELNLSEMEKKYADLEQMEKRAGWFEELAGLHEAKERALELNGKIESGRTGLEKVELAKSETEKKLSEIRASLNNENVPAVAMEEMERLKGLYSVLSNSDISIADLEKTLEALNSESVLIAEKLSDFSGLDERESEIESKEEAFRARQLELELRRGLSRFAEQLADGQPCPLCGSTEHPSPVEQELMEDDLLSEDAGRITQERAVLKQRIEARQTLNNEAAALDGRIEGVIEQLNSRKSDRQAVISRFAGSKYGAGDKEAFDADYEKNRELWSRREAMRAEADGLSEEQQRLFIQISELKDAEGRLKQELAAVQAGIDNSEARIDGRLLDENRNSAPEELAGRAAELRRIAEDIKKGYQAAEERVKAAGIQDEKNVTEFKLLEKLTAEQEETLAKAGQELEVLIRDSDYSNMTEVMEILGRGIDVRTERGSIEAFEKAITALRNEVTGLEGRMDGRVYKPGMLERAVEENEVLKQQLEQVLERRGGLSRMISDIKSRLVRRKELEKELEGLRLRGENLSLLKNLFKGKKFINYAATIYLRELCEAANVRFRKLTRESLRLELDEGNNFIIRDYLNEGKTRSVKTLSGGQTFQAAFSLSLALADSIGRERSGFFFLDEGFGSLDRESLTLVFDSLKSLKREKRTVGIISHVEELKQEIDTFITVRRDDEEGSVVNNSWS